jgi:transposase-like protein
MTEHDKMLSMDESTLIQHLIAGKSISEAARQLGIADKTARRWLDRPHVDTAYQELKRDVSAHVRDQIKALSTKAIKALEESLALQDAPTVRLRAAQMVLDRVAPEDAKALAQPLQGQESAGVLVPPQLVAYMAPEEIEAIERICGLAEQRMAQAESDRETLERKRI